MIRFTTYELGSGRLTCFISCPESMRPYIEAAPGEGLFECECECEVDGDGYFFNESAQCIVKRPEMPAQVTGQTITAPPYTEFDVRGPAQLSGQADGTGILEFEFDESGEYTIELRCFPYLDKEITLHAD